MDTQFLTSLCSKAVSDELVGYDDASIEAIEAFYDIQIKGQLRRFMQMMGRSDAGLLGAGLVPLYKSERSAKQHLAFQAHVIQQIESNLDASAKLSQALVFMSIKGTEYYLLQTGLEHSDRVYGYNMGRRELYETQWTLFECLRHWIWQQGSDLAEKSVGDLLASESSFF